VTGAEQAAVALLSGSYHWLGDLPGRFTAADSSTSTVTAGEIQAIGLVAASNDTYKVCVYTLLNAIMDPTDTTLDTNPVGWAREKDPRDGMDHHASKGTSPRKIVQIPTIGRPLGEWRQRAALFGMLDGEQVSADRCCLWMRSDAGTRTPLLWPAGYHARLDPLEVLNASGQLFARAGEHLVLGGGFNPVDPDDPCSLGRDLAFYVQDEAPARARSWREYIEAGSER
jgi:hypothetical protein